MKIVHFCQMAPNKSGMYESVKDQIKYERLAGAESDIIDPFSPKNVGLKDGLVEAKNWEIAKEAEVWVNHAGMPPPLQKYIENKKDREKHVIVANMHGPVEHMLFKECSASMLGNYENRPFTEIHINMIWIYDACVVINQHEYDISKLYDDNSRLHYIPNSIDLDRIDQEATDWPYVKRPAIVVADYPRFEKNPAHMIWAMPKVQEKLPDARLSVLGLPFENIEFWRNIFYRSTNWHLLRECIDNLQIKYGPVMPYMRGADIMYNCNFSGIASRVHMEGMAMGVPIVSTNGDYTKYHAKIFDLQDIADNIVQCWEDLQSSDLKQKTIDYAYENFDRSKYVPKYIELYKKLKEAKNV
jgi:glycosyltransferase involved in cell wall biosynthesis